MNKKSLVAVSSALMLSVLCGQTHAQNNPPTVEQLQKQLQQMQEEFRKQQELQRQQIQLLEQQLQQLKQNQTAITQEQQTIKQQVASAPAEGTAKSGDAVMDQPWRITDPIRLRKGAAFMDIGIVGTFAAGSSTANDLDDLQIGGHDPNQRGFTFQSLEANFTGAVDPYFRGNANVLFAIDGEGETFVELEEAWLESIALPGNFQIRAGQYLTEFGRINTQHPHSWSFVDAPLVNARFLGADGLRNPGARLSWLAPTPWYTELFLGLQNSQGATATGFRSNGGHSHGGEEAEGIPFSFRHADNNRGIKRFDDLLITPRLATSFNLTDNQTLLLGVSGAFGPNANGGGGENTRTEIYGADLTWKWRPENHSGGFPFVQFQTEAMMRKYGTGSFDWDEDADGLLADEDGDGNPDAGQLFDPVTGLPAILPAEKLTDYGLYSQLSYGFRKGWVAGLRFDYVTGDVASYQTMGLLEPDGTGGFNGVFDKFRATRYRVSPNLTWFPTEFSKIRLQYNYDDRTDIGIDHSVWLQFEFVLGAHAAHKF
ncbi:MAG: hypothetical protein ACO1QS_15070 [Verrucomicrobiota bacterium]